MRKIMGFMPAVFLLLKAPRVLAQANVVISPPAGSLGDICLLKIPQFIIQLIFIIGVLVAVAFLIYGGIKWILSGGDKQAVESARNHIVAAIVGLVIVAGAFVIIGVVFKLLGQTNPITNLTINDIVGNPLKCD